jgi:diguanylate cyclase (GGDEF)-like protein
MLKPRLSQYFHADLGTAHGRALVEEQYWSLRRQTPIVYLLGLVNVSALEIAATGTLSVGLNVPTLIAACAFLRLWHWYGADRGLHPSHVHMAHRLRETVWFAAIICIAVCARCVYLLQAGDTAAQMAVLLFGGLSAFGISYGLAAVPLAAWIPLVLVIGPISATAFLSQDHRFVGAAFGLVFVAALTMQLIGAHSRHFKTVIRSRSSIAREQEIIENARQEALVAATTDFLTGLPNRRAFVAALEDAMAARQGTIALAILDLNRFKTVNDTFGHVVGDTLLKEVAVRLVTAIGTDGLVARLGGDEFGVLLPEVRTARAATATCTAILEQVNGGALVGGRELTIALSCGVGLSRKGDLSPSRLMADADLALYEAKENAGGAVALFEPRMEAPRRRRAEIERALRKADVHDHLGVVFQPIFDLKSGRIVANEALARFSDSELGAVSPSEFVPIAEQLDLIQDIGSHLMRIAFEAACQWPPHIRLSFNLSTVQLCSSGMAATILAELKRTGLAAERLQVEVTETALLRDTERARINLAELKGAGAMIVLDDFGAGYASIGYLRELQFDQIKLDGGLVTAAQHSVDGKRLLRAVVGLCDILGVSTVAEHVESEQVLALVVELGCTAGQGFWLERPLPKEKLASLLDTAALPCRRAVPRAA